MDDGIRLSLPERLGSRAIALRREVDADIPFLQRLYRSTRWEEPALFGWTDAAKTAFLDQQCALQRHHYLAYYARTDFGIVTQSGAPIGRLYLDRGPREYRIVDISLLPEARGHGLGTELLLAVHSEATTVGLPVTIHVERLNPAQRLYRRLGFRPIGENGPYDFMEWPAARADALGDR